MPPRGDLRPRGLLWQRLEQSPSTTTRTHACRRWIPHPLSLPISLSLSRFVFQAAMRHVKDAHVQGGPDVHVMSCAMKAAATWTRVEVTQLCR